MKGVCTDEHNIFISRLDAVPAQLSSRKGFCLGRLSRWSVITAYSTSMQDYGIRLSCPYSGARHTLVNSSTYVPTTPLWPALGTSSKVRTCGLTVRCATTVPLSILLLLLIIVLSPEHWRQSPPCLRDRARTHSDCTSSSTSKKHQRQKSFRRDKSLNSYHYSRYIGQHSTGSERRRQVFI